MNWVVVEYAAVSENLISVQPTILNRSTQTYKQTDRTIQRHTIYSNTQRYIQGGPKRKSLPNNQHIVLE